MNYSEALEYIHSFLRFGSRPGLERIENLLKKLGSPPERLRVIHIAGTNGKGSTSLMLQTALTAAGRRCGLYVSPYVVNFRERIQIDGEYISESELCEYISRVKAVTDSLSEEELPTEFEIITATAFLYFAEKGVDAAVMEVGLGGRLDATNVISSPAASIITDIDLDHTAVLGNTLAEIAFEKCGIIKAGCPVITSETQAPEALEVIKRVAAERGAPLLVAGRPECISVSANGTEFDFGGRHRSAAMLGEHQAINASLVLTTLSVVEPEADAAAVEAGLSAIMPARCEVLRSSPLVMLDGSHNPAGGAALSRLLSTLGVTSATAVIGMMADKDTDGYLKCIAPYFENAVLVEVEGNPRAMSSEALLRQTEGLINNVFSAPDYTSALDTAFALSEASPLIVCGSLYLAGDIRGELLKRVDGCGRLS